MLQTDWHTGSDRLFKALIRPAFVKWTACGQACCIWGSTIVRVPDAVRNPVRGSNGAQVAQEELIKNLGVEAFLNDLNAV